MIHAVYVGPPPAGRGGGSEAEALMAATASEIEWTVIPQPRLSSLHLADLSDFDVAYTWTASSVRTVAAIAPRMPIVWQWILDVHERELAAVEFATRVLVVSERARQRVPEALRGRVSVIGHAPSRDCGGPYAALPCALPVVLSVGVLHPVKGTDELIRACDGLPCELWLVGEDKRPADRAFAANARLFGWQADPIPFFKSADLFVFPSRHREAAALVLLEAMACGCPVLASDTPDNRDTLGDAGAYCQLTVEELRAWISNLLSTPRVRAAMAECGRSIAQGRTWAAWVAAAVAQIRGVAGVGEEAA